MPTKIDFTSVYVSSEDDKHVALELNNHGPTVRGWQSAQSCTYPQDIILKLNKPAVLSKIQVLAHQYLIPEKLELWVNDEDGVESDMIEKRNFDYLGYIMLSDNQSTAFKSRELKSVTVPAKKATYLKLRLSKNHENAYNVHNQVSLIAINILGQEIQSEQKDESNMTSNNNGKISHLVNNPNYISPYDDLAFEMYVDTEVANIIREMDLKKHQAVMDERFEYARKIKMAIEKLTEAGGKLGKYDLEKRHAIDMEDYEKASKKKTQAETFRKETYQTIGITQLLEENGVNPLNDECTDVVPEAIQGVVQGNAEPGLASPPNLLAPTEATGREGAFSPCAPSMYHAPVSPLHHNYHNRPRSPGTASPTNNNLSGTSSSSGGHSRGGSFRRRNKSAGAASKSTFEQYEERTVPALRHSHTNEFLRECQIEVSIEAKMPSKLNDREKKQAALPILIFGNDLVEKFYSKQYSDKEEGLHRLKEELRNYDNNPVHPANKTARAAIFLLHRALRDKVFSIYSLSAEVIRMFFTEFVPSRVSQAEVARSVDRLLPELLTKSGDPTARIHNMAVHTILSMADCQNVRELHLIPVHLSRPVSSSTHPRLALSRMEMVEQLILNHGISNDKQSGLTCRTLSEFGASGLHHPAEPVRKVAERVLVLVYKVNPRLVRKQLPPDDDITRRNLLYRHLFHEFDKVDIQRKKDMIERNKQIQQTSSSTSGHPECTSPLGMSQPHAYSNCNYGGGTVTKSKSSSNVPYMINDDMTTEPANVTQHYVKFAVDCGTNSPADNNEEGEYIDVANSQVETTNGRYYNEVTESRYYDANDEFVKDHNNKSRKNSNEIEKDGSDLTKDSNAIQFCANKHIQLSSNGRNSASSTSGVSSPSDSSQREGDKACIFCSNFGNELQTLYTDEQLNSHYWRTCPMLTRCAQCGQVTEVSTLTAHRLVECTNSSEYRQCRRCREAVPLLAYVKHVAETKCIEAKIGYNKCPLCHQNIPQEDNSWKEHLMGGTKCPSNPRTNPTQIRSKSAAK